MESREYMRLALPGDLGPDCLQDDWRVDIHPQESMPVTFWDTFEWGIWYGGHALFSCGELYRLGKRNVPEDDWLEAGLCEEQATGRPRFWGDFKSEPMRGKLGE